MAVKHAWNSEFCSCGSDSVTCQHCGKWICGTLTQWLEGKGNCCKIDCLASGRVPPRGEGLDHTPRAARPAGLIEW